VAEPGDLTGIGGVMGAAAAGREQPGSVWGLWAAGWARSSAFRSARSALAALIRQRRPGRIWFPSYVCASLLESAAATNIDVEFYPCGRRLEPRLDELARRAKPGDAVVLVDYFGRPPDPNLLEIRGLHADLIWIEDRAQALDPAASAWGDVVLYSPRKLVGVADGGVMFSDSVLPRAKAPSSDGDLWAPEEARARDPDGRDPQTWYPLFRAREAAFCVDDAPISKVRRQNWRTLFAELHDFALWSEPDPVFVPLSFPILVDDAAATGRALANHRIWAPRHWAELPSSASDFPDAHWLSARCLSLPLDQRYGADDMRRLAKAVRSVTRPGSQPR
jgi:hypothetical protein